MDIRPTSNIVLSSVPPAARDAAAASAKDAAAASAKAAAAAAPIKVDGAPKQAGSPGKEELAQAINSINSVLQDRSPGLEFSIDRDSDRSVVKVVDKDTMEVIRQMPSREAMDIARALDKLHSLLVKDSA